MPKIQQKEDTSTKTLFLAIGQIVFGVSCIFLVSLDFSKLTVKILTLLIAMLNPKAYMENNKSFQSKITILSVLGVSLNRGCEADYRRFMQCVVSAVFKP